MKATKFIAELLFYALLGVLVCITGGLAFALFILVLIGRVFWMIFC